jgi:dienelactone hydrolase
LRWSRTRIVAKRERVPSACVRFPERVRSPYTWTARQFKSAAVLVSIVVLALTAIGCGQNDEQPDTAATTAPTDRLAALDGCVSASEATLLRFPGSEGEISAAVFGDGQVGVVVSNTAIGRVCDWLPWGKDLASDGYRVMLFDYSALMPTTNIPAAVETFAKDTVQAAVKLRELGAQQVVLIGGSAGGLAALNAASDDRAGADGIVCLSAAGVTDVPGSVGQLDVPVLFVAARDDFPAYRLADALNSAATRAATRKLVVVDGALHADNLLQPTAPTKQQVESEILAFLEAL